MAGELRRSGSARRGIQVSPALLPRQPLQCYASQLPAPTHIDGYGHARAVPAWIAFVGIPSGLSGATRINFVVPPTARWVRNRLWLTVGGITSPVATIMVDQ
jgi:hypothetical protein